LSYHLERRALGARKFFFALKENTGFNDDFGSISRCIKQNKELAKKKTKNLILRGAAGVGLQKNLRASSWLKKSQPSPGCQIAGCSQVRISARRPKRLILLLGDVPSTHSSKWIGEVKRNLKVHARAALVARHPARNCCSGASPASSRHAARLNTLLITCFARSPSGSPVCSTDFQ
jgi:hypothetical protein